MRGVESRGEMREDKMDTRGDKMKRVWRKLRREEMDRDEERKREMKNNTE